MRTTFYAYAGPEAEPLSFEGTRAQGIRSALLFIACTPPTCTSALVKLSDRLGLIGRWEPIEEDGKRVWCLAGATGFEAGELAKYGVDWLAERDRYRAAGGVW